MPNVLNDTIEISIDELESNIEKMEAQLEILKDNKTYVKNVERKIYSCGIDGQGKDYSVTSYYENGKLIKEEIRPINKD